MKIRPKKHVFERAYSQIKEYLCTDSQPTQAAVAQLVESWASQAQGRGFEPRLPLNIDLLKLLLWQKSDVSAFLTSGGDAPGMNAAIRAVTRSAISNGFKVKAIYRGYEGLMNGEVKTFTTEDVSGIIQTGGTILRTARSKDFQTPQGRKRAYDTLRKEGIDALIVIGGNGSLTGAMLLAEEYDFPCIGLPGTIDNDLYGTDNTIGYDTTLNTIMDCVDKIRRQRQTLTNASSLLK